MASVLERKELRAKLGKHEIAKACLYVHRLGDVDLEVLERLIAESVAERKRHQGQG